MMRKILVILFIIIMISSVSVSASEIISPSANECDKITNSVGLGWEQINEDGFGSSHNIAPRGIAIFNDTLVIGTINAIDYWAGVNNNQSLVGFLKSFIKIKLWKNFEGDGCEIWSYDGDVLKQIVGDEEEAVMPAGFGNKKNSEVGFLIEYKDYLYAGIHNHEEGGQIWRTRDLNEEWELVAMEGLGGKANAAFWVAEIFNDYLYIGTMNLIKGCEIFRTNDGVNFEVVVGGEAGTKKGFGTSSNFYAWSMCVYDDCLYVGTDNLQGGGELWKTQDGTTWKPVLAYKGWIEAKLHGADYPRGFDSGSIKYRGGIRRMIVYKDELYCGFTGEDILLNIFCQGKKLLTKPQSFLYKLHPFRYRDSIGLEIWKYNSSEDKWIRVVGGADKGNFSGGFGDIRNDYPWSMIVYEGYLYVGTGRTEPIDIFLYVEKAGTLLPRPKIRVGDMVGGAELWRFDGTEWQQINQDGFGDLNNLGIRALKIYKDCIIGATLNTQTGCEMWKYGFNSYSD